MLHKKISLRKIIIHVRLHFQTCLIRITSRRNRNFIPLFQIFRPSSFLLSECKTHYSFSFTRSVDLRLQRHTILPWHVIRRRESADSSRCYCEAQINIRRRKCEGRSRTTCNPSQPCISGGLVRGCPSRISYVTTGTADARKPRETASVGASGNAARAGCCVSVGTRRL